MNQDSPHGRDVSTDWAALRVLDLLAEARSLRDETRATREAARGYRMRAAALRAERDGCRSGVYASSAARWRRPRAVRRLPMRALADHLLSEGYCADEADAGLAAMQIMLALDSDGEGDESGRSTPQGR